MTDWLREGIAQFNSTFGGSDMTNDERLKEIEKNMNKHRGVVDNWILSMHSEDIPWLINRVKTLTAAMKHAQKDECISNCLADDSSGSYHSNTCIEMRQALATGEEK